MEEEAKKKLKAAELQCKKDKVKMWANYVPPATNSKAIHDQNFTGKVTCLQKFFLNTVLLLWLLSYWFYLSLGSGSGEWGLSNSCR